MENLSWFIFFIFFRHSLKLCKITDCLVKLTTEDDRPMYSSNSNTPKHIWDEILAELNFMDYYGIIITLLFLKYCSSIFVQLKSSAKVGILIEF